MEHIKNGDKLSMSKDLLQENIEKLKDLFPELITENKIDFNVFRDVFGDEVEEEDEYYRFTWAGKAQARREAHKPSTGTLRPVKEDSVDWNTTENVYIEGDNLEVLKLLQKSYAGKVKMIYIDPPYNTGKDFVYKDNYKDNLKNYQEVTGQIDSEGNKLSTNSDSDGRYHSNWLNMMYPRLRLARNLLKEDGVIFISIDDNEVDNLKKIGNEIFGEENFIASIIWKHTQQSKNDERHFSRQFNYNIAFAKNLSELENFRFERTVKDNKNYSNIDNDPNGDWRSGDVRSPNLRKTLCFNIQAPDGSIIPPPEKGWRWSEETIKDKIDSGEIIFKKDNSGIIRKIYLVNQEGRTPENVWNGDEYGTTRYANSEIKELFEDITVFDTPKPTKMIMKLLELFYKQKDSIILDFFSGSGTTAHATMKMNATDGGNRKYIQVQLPELTNEKSEAFKSSYKTITEIGKERIRRAAKKIAEENPEKAKDLGFKVFKLDSSNIKSWDGNPDNLQEELFDTVSNIKTDRTEEDVLYEILLKYGLDLTLPIEEKIIEGKTVFNVGFGALFICLGDNLTNKIAEGIGAWKEELQPEICRVIFKDTGFTDVEKTNSLQTLKRFGITEIKSI
ncbi:site-specific DNA-methyltransferase [Tenacibaculum piscium]|uniref:site-specific DNA-methyltransferase n=1 Tax=Tenacibaculum piscium TaxID=1458515 RepID=UPI001F2D1B92|nr:site-specific DNA-methyltransferase [Tenacibaculum piscium]